MPTEADLTLELLSLPIHSRAALAVKLISSLDEAGDPDAEARWIQELRRRKLELDQGEVQGRPADVVMREAQSRLKG